MVASLSYTLEILQKIIWPWKCASLASNMASFLGLKKIGLTFRGRCTVVSGEVEKSRGCGLGSQDQSNKTKRNKPRSGKTGLPLGCIQNGSEC